MLNGEKVRKKPTKPSVHLCTGGSSWHNNIKNTEASDVLPYSQANQVACQSCMDAGRSYETPVSDTTQFIFYSNSCDQSISTFWNCFAKSQFS